ncbi:MAG: 2-dehydro-3-deoxy-D-gluconate 5-dehydrogenase KduD [Reinekea sp.]|jgi:2-deoxy-D-gluconate 3-dehydrogenase|nr:2-dehydro-3-deoxy-D-gluconate 5-dehydrogenase KduD [Reinekea sp.]
MFDLTGKTAIVTGSNVGLGQGIALGLAKAGADIVGVSIGSGDEMAKEVEALGRKFHFIQADLTSIEKVDHIVAEAEEVFGSADVLVNNAGLIRREDSVNFSEADWDLVMNINLKTPFFLAQAFAKRAMAAERAGKIINIASMLSFQGGIRVPSYTSSKSGIMGLTRLLACEWAPHHINVNAIAPGYFATANTKDLRADPVRSKEILDRIPAARWGDPSDLAGPAVFLASAASDYVNGYTIAVDGGWLAR